MITNTTMCQVSNCMDSKNAVTPTPPSVPTMRCTPRWSRALRSGAAIGAAAATMAQ